MSIFVEDKVKVGAATNAPDYSFGRRPARMFSWRRGGAPKTWGGSWVYPGWRIAEQDRLRYNPFSHRGSLRQQRATDR